MEKELVAALIIGHFLLDWILQPRRMARMKSSSLRYLAAHLLINFTGLLIITSAFSDAPFSDLLFLNLVNITTHGIIDRYIWPLSGHISGRFSGKETGEYIFYSTIAVDQALHLVILVWLFL